MSKFSAKVSAVDVYFSLLTANWFAIVTFPLGETSGTRTVNGIWLGKANNFNREILSTRHAPGLSR